MDETREPPVDLVESLWQEDPLLIASLNAIYGRTLVRAILNGEPDIQESGFR